MNDPAEKRSTDFGCLFLLVFIMALVVLIASLAASFWSLAIIAGTLTAGALTGAYYFIQIQPRKRFERMLAEREGYAREDFLGHFEALGLRREAVEEARDVLQSWLPWGGFPVRPGDELERDLGITVHEEIDEILQACLCREPSEDEWTQANDLRTVEDFVILVDRLYTGEPQEWNIWQQQAWTWRDRLIVALVFLAVLILPVVALFGYIRWLIASDGRVVIGIMLALGLAIIGSAALAVRSARRRPGQT